jgi:hypothetical protein
VSRELRGKLTCVFLPGYDMRVAAALVAGCDLWLNTPFPPMEAAGTSGMKAALNGVINLSILDGWWGRMAGIELQARCDDRRASSSQASSVSFGINSIGRPVRDPYGNTIANADDLT